MKKILATTTAFVSILAGSAFADDATKFDLKMHGLATVEYGVRSQKGPYTATIKQGATDPSGNAITSAADSDVPQGLSTNQKNSAFYNQARFSVEATAKADAGFTYGGVIGLATNANPSTGKNSSTTDNTYAFIESSTGRVEVGSNYSASKTMALSGGTVARGSGGAAGGDWDNFISKNYVDPVTGKVVGFTETTDSSDTISKTSKAFLTSNGLIGDSYNSGPNSEQANRITYYTPVVSGFQLGASYTPDTDNTSGQLGKSYVALNPGTRTLKNAFNLGLKYTHDFEQVSIGLSAVGVSGKVSKNETDTTKNHDLTGGSVGGLISYGSFSASGNYGYMNKKFFTYDDAASVGTALDPKIAKNATFYSGALAYVQGPFGVSLTYYASENYNKNKFNAYGLSADYQLAPGMKTYAEYVNFAMKPNALSGTTVQNKGNVFLVGTQFAF